MVGPFTTEAVLLSMNMLCMWLTAGCLVRPYELPRWVQRWGVVVFFVAFAMSILNLNMWLGTLPLANVPWRGK